MWPAIWMMGSGRSWPGCGEMDIMENVGFNPEMIYITMHTQKYNHTRRKREPRIKIAKPWEIFTFMPSNGIRTGSSLTWTAKSISPSKTRKKGHDTWPFDKPERLKLNIAVGGGWGGQKGIDDSIFPQKMEIAYVRIYQQTK